MLLQTLWDESRMDNNYLLDAVPTSQTLRQRLWGCKHAQLQTAKAAASASISIELWMPHY
jgi:hypothetical protein